ncbi:hypothetical protein DFH06DRAFT_715405 [Mycena polygramma]|nr:hypothetical protein DFH06DRAFT_715405 [Mycena polygramma]
MSIQVLLFFVLCRALATNVRLCAATAISVHASDDALDRRALGSLGLVIGLPLVCILGLAYYFIVGCAFGPRSVHEPVASVASQETGKIKLEWLLMTPPPAHLRSVNVMLRPVHSGEMPNVLSVPMPASRADAMALPPRVLLQPHTSEVLPLAEADNSSQSSDGSAWSDTATLNPVLPPSRWHS